MARRFVKFRNYRNIGVSKDGSKFEQFSLNSSLEKDDIGELITVIGENNVGKSNILDGINVITSIENLQHAPLTSSDAPDFMGFEDCEPEIKLVYDDVDGKSCDASYFIDNEEKARFKTSSRLEEKDGAPIKLKMRLTKAIKEEFAAKFNAYTDKIKEYTNNQGGNYLKRLNTLINSYNVIISTPEGIDVKKLKDVYLQLQVVLDDFVKAYNTDCSFYPAKQIEALEFINLDSLISYYAISDYTEDKTMTVRISKDVIKEKCGISLVPQIVYYKEKEIKDSDLAATPEAVKDSKFFASLLKAAGKSIDTITQAYEKAKKAPSFKKKFKDSINEALQEKVSKKFNALYFHGTLTQEYSFEIDLGKDEIYLEMEKNGNTISLSQQSTGFKWFFNFFFNFLYAADLQAGDIVLMDEPDAHLAIPAKRELRRFLKDFAKSTGVTFIATTQHPEFIDPDFLDELRIIRHKREEGEVGAEIQNKFYAIGEDEADTINEVLAAFGLQHRDIITDPNNTVVYVEGITDYNYLTAFKRLKEAEEGKKIALAFLPIGGLGEDEEQMKKKIPVLARHKDAVLLTDSDTKADIFKKTCGADAQVKDRLRVFQLREFGEDFIEIESLFAPADKERHKEMIENKSGAASALFKRNIFDLDKKEEIHGQTKANFYRVLEYLASVN